jgi:hypothetical protein
MKILSITCLGSLFVGVSLVALAIAPAIRTTATLTWDYPPDEVSNVTFNIYFTTNISSPPNWNVITNVVGTNALVPIMPGNGFFFATASNQFGESIPSNTVTSTVARNVNVKIK